MKIEQPYENWTRFPNCILDHLNRFTGNELKVLALMIRKNLGWSKPNKQFSGPYISKKTGMDRVTVIKALTSLIEKGSIVEIDSGPRNIRRFEVNWEPPPPVEISDMLKNSTGTCGKNQQVPDEESNRNLLKKSTQYKKPLQESQGKKPAAPLLDEEWEKEAEKVVNLLCKK